MNARHFREAVERRLLDMREESLAVPGVTLPKRSEGRTSDGSDAIRGNLRASRTRARRDLVRALTAAGRTVQEISDQLGIERRTVYACRSAFAEPEL